MGAGAKSGIELHGADWGFTDDREWYAEFTRRVGLWGRGYLVDPDDMVQQAALWAAGKHDVTTLKPAQAAMRARSVWRSQGSKGRKHEDASSGLWTFDRPVPGDHAELLLMLAVQSELSEKEWDAVVLRLQGYTLSQVGERLGISESAVRFRITSAGERLVGAGVIDFPEHRTRSKA